MVAIVVFHFNVSLMTHYVGKIRILPDSYLNGNLGQVGVSLFFIISGAALMYSYQNDLSLITYFKKRFLAIFPMFWISYICVISYLFFRYYTINPFGPPVQTWTFLLSLIGMDGYLLTLIPNHYLIGEWFLGCIIALYIIFPLLRFMMLKQPVITAVGILVIYTALVKWYSLHFQIDYNFVMRIPEFIFGMYFVKYFKRVNIYVFAISMLITIEWFIKPINIPYMYKITVIGMCIFLVLVFIGQYIKNDEFKKPFLVISKYSFAIFLVHHVIIEQLLTRFNSKVISHAETYLLFFITCIVIAIVAIFVSRLTAKISNYTRGQINSRKTEYVDSSQ